MMGLNGKYSVGILLTFTFLAAVMLYGFSVVSTVTGIKGITPNSFLLSRVAIWMVLAAVFLYNLFIEKEPFY